MTDFKLLFVELDKIKQDQKLSKKVFEMRGKIVFNVLNVANWCDHFNTFEKYLCSNDVELQKSKSYMLQWFFEPNIVSGITNITSILLDVSQLLRILLEMIEFVANCRQEQQEKSSTLFSWFYSAEKSPDFFDLKTNLAKVSNTIQERQLHPDSFEQNFPEFFDLDKVVFGNTLIKHLKIICLTLALK